ncbi:EpsG family protein [Novosphingobium resinovorum]|uniref:EpsG family protein n=1 Tax=Novosphingobium resinovorum TaxID=158500 RepID=UPI002ED35216|nr:EpsG family protein [Novosphingobium resinovorum]
MILILIFGMIIWSIVDPRRSTAIYCATLAIVIAALAQMNMNKDMSGDWVWYTQHYLRLEYMNFFSYLGAKIGSIVVKWNEPVYYAICKIVSVYSRGDIPTLALVITLIDYVLVGVAVFRVGGALFVKEGRNPNAIALIGCVLLAMSFTLVTHLVRQVMGASFCILGYSYLRRGNQWMAGALAVIALLTHQSVALLVLILYAPVLLELYFKKRSTRRLFSFGAILVAAALGYYISHSSISSLGQKDDGSISIGLVLIDAAIFAALAVVVFTNRRRDMMASHFLLSYLIFYAALMTLLTVPLAVLRIYFYLDFVRTMALLLLVIKGVRFLPKALDTALPGVGLLGLGLLYVGLRIDRAPFDFGGSLWHYLAYPIF